MHEIPAASQPLVSIGVPVRNGAAFLPEALALLGSQTYRHLEIIISDNGSTDGSQEIISAFAASDSRVRVYRQSRTLTAFDNFRFVFEQSHGDYFMWAACDDRRSLDYVERLLDAMLCNPDAALAFGEVTETSDAQHWQSAKPAPYAFETAPSDSVKERLVRYTRINCLHIYGLLRSKSLRSYQWPDIDNGPDIPLLVHLAFMGEFVRANAACFYYYVPPTRKTMEERALVNSLHRLQRFPEVRLAWACARSAHQAGQVSGRQVSKLGAFAIVYLNRHWRWLKPAIFERSPKCIVLAYRKWLKRAAG